MSVFFLKYCLPPPSHFSTWLRDYVDVQEARNLVLALKLIQTKTTLPWLPRDVWNHIVKVMYETSMEYNPSRWVNFLGWLIMWMTHPIQQMANPMLVDFDRPFETFLGAVTKDPRVRQLAFAFNGRVIDGVVAVPRVGDLMLGIILTEEVMNHVTGVQLEIRGTVLTKPFDFKKYAQVGKYKVCYHPELPVIPLEALQFSQVRLLVSGAVQTIQSMCSYLSLDDSVFLRKTNHCFVSDVNKFYVLQGMGGYETIMSDYVVYKV